MMIPVREHNWLVAHIFLEVFPFPICSQPHGEEGTRGPRGRGGEGHA